jgi:Domain of unknown function (DUF1840)
MLYKFKSKAAGDVIMLEPSGNRVLTILGKEPAAQGIIEVADMGAAIAALEAAVAADEAATQNQDPSQRERVTLRQRAWPLVEMLKRAQRAGHPIVWGV